MIKMKYILFTLLLCSISNLMFAKIPAQISFSIGSISSNYAESESSLESTDGTDNSANQPYSGTASSMPLDISFEYFNKISRSYFIKGTGPIMGSTPDRFFSVNIGTNFYFNQIGSQTVADDTNVSITIQPKYRYYAGPQIGVGYLVYNTKSQTKNDVMVDLGGQVGAIYTINDKWGLRGQLEFTRGIGALISSTTIKILLGSVYSLNID